MCRVTVMVKFFIFLCLFFVPIFSLFSQAAVVHDPLTFGEGLRQFFQESLQFVEQYGQARAAYDQQIETAEDIANSVRNFSVDPLNTLRSAADGFFGAYEDAYDRGYNNYRTGATECNDVRNFDDFNDWETGCLQTLNDSFVDLNARSGCFLGGDCSGAGFVRENANNRSFSDLIYGEGSAAEGVETNVLDESPVAQLEVANAQLNSINRGLGVISSQLQLANDLEADRIVRNSITDSYSSSLSRQVISGDSPVSSGIGRYYRADDCYEWIGRICEAEIHDISAVNTLFGFSLDSLNNADPLTLFINLNKRREAEAEDIDCNDEKERWNVSCITDGE